MFGTLAEKLVSGGILAFIGVSMGIAYTKPKLYRELYNPFCFTVAGLFVAYIVFQSGYHAGVSALDKAVDATIPIDFDWFPPFGDLFLNVIIYPAALLALTALYWIAGKAIEVEDRDKKDDKR